MITITQNNTITNKELHDWIKFLVDHYKKWSFWTHYTKNHYIFECWVNKFIIKSLWTAVKHIWIIFEKYLQIEGLKFTDNFVSIPKNYKNMIQLEKILFLI